MQEKNISFNNFEQCIKCTICTAYCPVVAVNPLYPGPKQAGPDGERLRLKNKYFFDENLKYCMNCKRCEVACPSGVKIADLIHSARRRFSTATPGLRDRLLASTDFMGRMARPFAPVVNFMVASKPVKAVMDATLHIDSHRTFPKYKAHGFESWFRKEAQDSQKAYSKQVAFFHGCSTEFQQPEVGKAFVTVMNAVGYGVQLMDEKCCGVAMISNGMWNGATKHAKHNVAEFEKKVCREMGLIDEIIPRYRTTYFNHIFNSGYSAGYYSYLWAEVLDKDAFEYFQQQGIYNPEVALKFRQTFLEKGGSEEPMTLYLSFRGAQPDPGALLRARGLTE